MIKAVPYYRVSSQRQGQSGLGLAAQRKAVHAFANANNYEIIKEFKEVESARNSKHQPLLLKALDLCKKSKAVLLIANLDRLGRNVAFIAALMEAGVKFIIVDNPTASEFIVHILAAVAELEHKTVSRRTKAALAEAKARGVQLGSYAKVLAKKRQSESMAFARKMQPVIENLQSNGFETIRDITDELNKKKVKTATGKHAKWHISTVHKLIKQIDFIITNKQYKHT